MNYRRWGGVGWSEDFFFFFFFLGGGGGGSGAHGFSGGMEG